MHAKSTLPAELIAEFLGTFVLILFGIGVVAMVNLFPSNTPGEIIHGGFTNVTLGWGLAVTMGIYVAGSISGAHLNPAVTLTMAVFRGFSWPKVIPYCFAQTAGAFVAAALVYRNYLPAFRVVDPEKTHTASVFTTFPAFPEILHAGFLDQVIGTGLLLLLIFAITDEFNSPPGPALAPLMIGLVVVAIGISFGGMHGYAINPARDFGPRLFTVVAGFHNNGITDRRSCVVGASTRAPSRRPDWGRDLRFRNPAILTPIPIRHTQLSQGGALALCLSSRSRYNEFACHLVRSRRHD